MSIALWLSLELALPPVFSGEASESTPPQAPSTASPSLTGTWGTTGTENPTTRAWSE